MRANDHISMHIAQSLDDRDSLVVLVTIILWYYEMNLSGSEQKEKEKDKTNAF